MKTETRCIHAGSRPDRITRGINTPIYTSSAFDYLDRDNIPYPRYFNTPNQQVVVEKLCALEQAEDGVLFSSGMAAMSTSVLAVVKSGDHVVLMDDLYGGTHAMATALFPRMGVTHTFAGNSADEVCAAVTDATRLIVIESPTNPLLNVIDIRQVTEFARQRGILTLMDNTFATPIHQQPFTLGVDIVIHSGTKYLGGHSDLCCGIAVAGAENACRIHAAAINLGGSLDAAACYLLERSLKTLALRVERQSQNALELAGFLLTHPMVRRVNYPGLPDFPGHEVAKAQMSGFGAMLSFEVDGNAKEAEALVRRLKLIQPAVSLGGIESTICSPALTSHAKISATERARIGISDALLRLSVGIEHIDDLKTDISQALIQ